MSNITLNTKVYYGAGVNNGVGQYVERSGGVASSFSPVTGSVKLDTKSRINWKLVVPIVSTEASACACPGEVLASSDASISIRIDPGLTVAQRTDFALRLKDLVASAEFQSSIIDLAQPNG